MLDGRVKTLHPKIHGGLLAIRSNKDHMDALKSENISPIDLIIVNFYPFEKTVPLVPPKLFNASFRRSLL